MRRCSTNERRVQRRWAPSSDVETRPRHLFSFFRFTGLVSGKVSVSFLLLLVLVVTASFFFILVPGGYIPRLESKKRECWKFLDKRLNSENDSRLHGQPSNASINNPEVDRERIVWATLSSPLRSHRLFLSFTFFYWRWLQRTVQVTRHILFFSFLTAVWPWKRHQTNNPELTMSLPWTVFSSLWLCPDRLLHETKELLTCPDIPKKQLLRETTCHTNSCLLPAAWHVVSPVRTCCFSWKLSQLLSF